MKNQDSSEIIYNYKENLRLVEERISEYVPHTDVPLQLFKEKKYLEDKILEWESKNHNDISKKIEFTIEELDDMHTKLIQQGWQEKNILEVEQTIETLQIYYDSFKLQIKNSDKNTIDIVLRKASRIIRKYKKDINLYTKLPVSSTKIISEIIKPEHFIDREIALKNISEHFSKNKIIVIAGVSGTGKTIFVEKFISEQKDIKPIWIKCSTELSIEDLFVSISDFVIKKYNFPYLRKALSYNTSLSESTVSVLIMHLDKIRPTIILDDFHQASEHFYKIVNFINDYSKSSKLIILTQKRVKILKDLFFTSHTEIILGIEKHYIKKYLKKYKLDINDKTVAPIFKLTKGHPLSLKLFASLCSMESYEPEELIDEFQNIYGEKIKTEFLDKIYQSLSSDEITLLKKASVFKNSIDRKAFDFILEKPSNSIFSNLISRFLISKTTTSKFSLHDTIRNYFYEKLEDKKTVHKLASDYYLSIAKSTDEYIDSYHHLYRGGYYNEALNSILPVYDDLLLHGKYEISFEIIKQLSNKLSSIPGKLLLYKAIILETWGNWDESLDILNKIIGKNDASIFLKSLDTIIHIYEQKSEYQEAIELFFKYKEQINLNDKTAELARLYHRIGLIYMKKNKFDESIKNYVLSIEISENIKDNAGIIETTRSIGVLYWFQGHYDKAHDKLTRVYSLCTQYNYVRELCDTAKHIGIVYCKKQQYEKSIDYFNRSIEDSNQINYKHGLAWSLMNSADAFIPLERYEEAEQNLYRAKQIFEQLKEKQGILNTIFRIGIILNKKDKEEDGIINIDAAYNIAVENNFILYQAMISEYFAEYYKSKNISLAIQHLEKTISIYKSINYSKAEINVLQKKLNVLNQLQNGN